MEKELVVSTISPTNIRRIDQYLVQVYPDYSRAFFQKLIKSGAITVNQKKIKPDYSPHSGDKIKIIFPDQKVFFWEKSSLKLKILFEDNEILVINKPSGIAVHPTGYSLNRSSVFGQSITILDLLLDQYPAMSSGNWSRPGIVHRLDKGTSGVMVIAKTPSAQVKLMRQFAQRKVEKTYLGVVYGKFKEKNGIIEASLMRDINDRKKFCIGPGRFAVTKFKVKRSCSEYTLLEIKPVTGRTHQIRVHLTSIGHPLAGDPVYGRQRQLDLPPGIEQRLMLHAYKLQLFHPTTNKIVQFIAELPEDFKQILSCLGL